MRNTRYLIGFSLLVALLGSPPSSAHDIDQDEALRLRQDGLILPLDTLLERALSRYPGARLLEAELEFEDGIYMYEVELLTHGGVAREIELDAATGHILKDEED